MVYDDDTSGQPRFHIGNDDRSPDRMGPGDLPPKPLQDRIFELADDKGWDAEQIEAHLRVVEQRNVHVEIIRWVLAQDRTRQ
jgi:hypothetical protein